MHIAILLKAVHCPSCNLSPVQSPFLGFDTQDVIEPHAVFSKQYHCNGCKISFTVNASLIVSVDAQPAAVAIERPENQNNAFECRNCHHMQAYEGQCSQCGSINISTTSL